MCWPNNYILLLIDIKFHWTKMPLKIWVENWNNFSTVGDQSAIRKCLTAMELFYKTGGEYRNLEYIIRPIVKYYQPRSKYLMKSMTRAWSSLWLSRDSVWHWLGEEEHPSTARKPDNQEAIAVCHSGQSFHLASVTHVHRNLLLQRNLWIDSFISKQCNKSVSSQILIWCTNLTHWKLVFGTTKYASIYFHAFITLAWPQAQHIHFALSIFLVPGP